MKSKFKYILIASFLIFLSIYYGGYVKKYALFANDNLIDIFHNAKQSIIDKINEHFNQVEEIKALREKNAALEQSSALLSTFANELNMLLEDKNSSLYYPQISLVKALSYVQIGDFRRVWLSGEYQGTKNRGLIYQGYTAGIAVSKNGRLMGLLQGDENCVFSVFVGKSKIPGIAQGQNGKIVVKFIPKGNKINVGDEVLTSGLDEIFFVGVPVGKISRIIDEDMYQSAELSPFAEISLPSFMYLVERF